MKWLQTLIRRLRKGTRQGEERRKVIDFEIERVRARQQEQRTRLHDVEERMRTTDAMIRAQRRAR